VPQRVSDRRGGEIDLAPVSRLLDRIIAEWDPDQVWLFGSRARGEARTASDWDLLVVVPEHCDSALDPVSSWRLARESGVRADILPCLSGDFVEDCATPNTLAHEAVIAGVLVYCCRSPQLMGIRA
jgi:uncharacterized protein